MTRLAALIGLLLAATPAWAQPIDLSGGGPVEITSRDGIEFRDNEHVAIATGDARATRDNVTVLADTLVARLRKKTTDSTGAPLATQPAPAAGATPGDDNGGYEVYRLEAHGHVRIVTATDEALGDDAVYDIDQAVLLMTGKNLKLTTPTQLLTARDSLEYWSQKHMGVGRGNAVLVTSDARRIAADVLVAYTTDPDQPGTPKTVSTTPAAAAKPGDDPLNAAGKLQRAEAYGNVEVRTNVDIVRGDRGVYVTDIGIARVVGHVRITHNGSQVNGPAADVNMKTGIARINADPGGRVSGVIVPKDAGQTSDAPKTGPSRAAPARPPAAKGPAS